MYSLPYLDVLIGANVLEAAARGACRAGESTDSKTCKWNPIMSLTIFGLHLIPKRCPPFCWHDAKSDK
jgi:hypothetical protein